MRLETGQRRLGLDRRAVDDRRVVGQIGRDCMRYARPVPIHTLDQIRLAALGVTRAGVYHERRLEPFDLLKDVRRAPFDDGHHVCVDRSQLEPRGVKLRARVCQRVRVSFRRQARQIAFPDQPVRRSLGRTPERLQLDVRDERPFVCGRPQVTADNVRIGERQDSRLDARRVEKLRGVPDEEVIQDALERYEEREALAATAPRPPRLLPQGAPGSLPPEVHRAVEPADVDPQLERVGRDHPFQIPPYQALLDIAAFARAEPGPIHGQRRRQPPRPLVFRRRRQDLHPVRIDELGEFPSLGKHDRREPFLHALCEEDRALVDRALSTVRRPGHEPRQPDHHGPFRRRRRVCIDHQHVLPDQRPRKLCRIRQRRRAQVKPQPTTASLRQPFQPPHDHRHVRAKRPAVDVRLVQHDHRQILKQPTIPRLVIRQRHAQKVGVRQQQPRLVRAQRIPILLRHVPVQNPHQRRRPQHVPDHRPHLGQLIVRQRLGGIHHDRDPLFLLRQHHQRRQQVTQALTRARRRRHDEIPIPTLPRLHLMLVQPLNARLLERPLERPRHVPDLFQVDRRPRPPGDRLLIIQTILIL